MTRGSTFVCFDMGSASGAGGSFEAFMYLLLTRIPAKNQLNCRKAYPPTQDSINPTDCCSSLLIDPIANGRCEYGVSVCDRSYGLCGI